MEIPQKTSPHHIKPGIARPGCGILVMLAICCWWMVLSAQAQFNFPGAPRDDYVANTTAVFKVTMSPTYGGGTYVVWGRGPTCIGLSASQFSATDPSTTGLGDGTQCSGTGLATSDAQIAPFPAGYNTNPIFTEVHSEIRDMNLTGNGFTILAGQNLIASGLRSLGEIEARQVGADSPANSFFNLYLEILVPAFAGGPMTLTNQTPLTVEIQGIMSLPPMGGEYLHSFKIRGKIPLFDTAGCFAGWIEEGNHGLGATGGFPPLPRAQLEWPVVFSVDVGAEGLLQPDPCHPWPNDVFSLGTAGGYGYATEGELFQASGFNLPMGTPDNTNVDIISASLGIGPVPGGGPPFTGPFNPPAAAPPPPGGAGTLGLAPGDNINAVSFGWDGGDTLLFSVDPNAMGVAGSAVNFEAVVSPFSGMCVNGGGGPPSASIGGDPGQEAAGDIFISTQVIFPPWGAGPPIGGMTPAPFGSNILGWDELNLGLQGADTTCSALGSFEDDLDALEEDTASAVDPNQNGVIEMGEGYIYFSVDLGSPSAAAEDVMVSVQGPPPGAGFVVYAAAPAIGLQAGDDIDALCVSDRSGPVGGPDGIWNLFDTMLFSLAAGSPTLAAIGASPGDVFVVTFTIPVPTVLVTAAQLGLQSIAAGYSQDDELNALDIGWSLPCHECNPSEHEWCVDSDGDGYFDPCDNAPGLPNPDQTDSDADGIGDVGDNCPFDYNPDQDPSACCECPGDMDRSNNVDYGDLPLFVEALLESFEPDDCADVNEDDNINGKDIQPFVEMVLANGGAGTPCPGSEPTGACCHEDMSCTDDMTESECDGPWYEGQPCSDIACPSFTCVEPGQDCWVTQCDGHTGYGFDQTPLQAGFFGPGSDPFEEFVALGGPPGGGSGPNGSDTLLDRLERMCFVEPLPATDSTPLELVMLELVSCQPITVTYDDGQNSEDWDVVVDLSGAQPQGTLTATKTHANGGTFDSDFYVQPRFTFTKISDPSEVVIFDTLDAGIDPMLLSSTGEPWLHTVTIGPSCSPNFAAGYDIVDDVECCEEVCHAGPTPDHPHCVLPPYCEILCPKPPDNDNCEEAKTIGDVVDYAFDTTYATTDGIGTCMTSPNIWFCYTASCTGNLIVSLCGSGYDTKLAVYDGCTCSPLGVELCCNDDYCGLQSECIVPVVEGGQYLIEVGGYGSVTGQGVMNISCCLPPPNDDCEDAEVVNSPYPVVVNADLTCAGIDCPGVLASNWSGVWYDLELPYASQNVQITICPTDEDMANVGIVLMDDCACDDYIVRDGGAEYITCPNGLAGYDMVFSGLTGPGRIFYPAYAIGDSGSRLAVEITIDVIPLGCISPDNGTGTVDLPPEDCPYISPAEVHMIIDGLPPGTTIELDPIHSFFFNVSRYPGGSLGGEVEVFSSSLLMVLTGTGELEGFVRDIEVLVDCEVHTGPRTPGDPVQAFPNDMYSLEGAITGDPDFELLNFVAGTSFGMPGPGETTLTQLPSGDFAVDSFFDITYQIDFAGDPTSPWLAGMAGSTIGTIHMETGDAPPP